MKDNFVTSFLMADTHGIPNFVWGLIAAGGIGVGVWFKNRSNNSQPTTIDASQQTATGTGPVDTSGGGNPVILGTPTQTNPVYVTTVKGDTLYTVSQQHRIWGWLTILKNNIIDYPTILATASEDSPLPGGLRLQVG